MKKAIANTMSAAVLLLGMTLCIEPLCAQARQDLYSPVLLGVEYAPPNRPIQIRPDGTGLQAVVLNSELTHDGRKRQRYHLQGEAVTGLLGPDGAQFYDLVSYLETADPATRRRLTPDGTICATQPGDPPCIFRRPVARWSVDGGRIAYVGHRYAFVGDTWVVIEAGIYVGDVNRDANGAPLSLTNEHLAIRARTDTSPVEKISEMSLSWSGDDASAGQARIAYDSSLGYFVAEIPPGLVEGASYPLQLTVSGVSGSMRFCPAFGDNRIVFRKLEPGSIYTRTRLWTVWVPAGFDGSYALTPQQIMNKTNTTNDIISVYSYAWSPDGSYLAFTASDQNGTIQIYKMSSDGASKVIKLTNSKKQGYLISQWRR